jgi:hypothetical protein
MVEQVRRRGDPAAGPGRMMGARRFGGLQGWQASVVRRRRATTFQCMTTFQCIGSDGEASVVLVPAARQEQSASYALPAPISFVPEERARPDYPPGAKLR